MLSPSYLLSDFLVVVVETTTESSTFPGAWLQQANFPVASCRLGEDSWLEILYLFRANSTGAMSQDGSLISYTKDCSSWCFCHEIICFCKV